MTKLLFTAIVAIAFSSNMQAQSTEGKKVDKLVNNTIKSLKKLDTADVSTFRSMMISDEGIQAFIDAMAIEEEFKEEIRANVKDGMFETALEGSFQDFVRITGNMKIDWKKIAYEDFIFEMRKRDGLKQLRGDLFFAEGEKHLKVQVTAALLDGKYVIIEMDNLSGARLTKDDDRDEIAREIEQAIEDAAEEREYKYENIEEAPAPVPPPVIIEEPDNRTREERIAMEVIDFPDLEAQFPGGMSALQQYIMENVKYPVEALEKGIQGRVYLSFVVEKDGTLTQIKVERGVSAELDSEAKRVVRAMPKWKPGEAAGRTVRTRCRLPIAFVLEEDVEDEK